MMSCGYWGGDRDYLRVSPPWSGSFLDHLALEREWTLPRVPGGGRKTASLCSEGMYPAGSVVCAVWDLSEL